MTASPPRRRSPIRAIFVLAALYLGTLGTFPANAVAAGGRTTAPWAAMTVSVRARTVAPAESQAPYDATIALAYTVTNVGRVPVYTVALTDALLRQHRVECEGASVIRVLPVNASVTCDVSVELTPGTYTSRPDARGWAAVLLVLDFPVEASGTTTFTVAAPPPSSPPASPSPSPTPSTASASPSRPAAPTTAPGTQATSPAPPSSNAPPSPSSSPSPQARSATPLDTLRRAAYIPPAPPARIHRLATNETVLLLMLPAAVGAAVAGAAAARRR